MTVAGGRRSSALEERRMVVDHAARRLAVDDEPLKIFGRHIRKAKLGV
jgi:hypothetical protein